MNQKGHIRSGYSTGGGGESVGDYSSRSPLLLGLYSLCCFRIGYRRAKKKNPWLWRTGLFPPPKKERLKIFSSPELFPG